MDPRGHMENLGYSWRYSNMSWVVMREVIRTDLLVTILWRHIGLFCRAMAAWVRCGCLRGWFHLQKPGRWGNEHGGTAGPAEGSGVRSGYHTHQLALSGGDCRTWNWSFSSHRATLSCPRSGAAGRLPRLRVTKKPNVSWSCGVSLQLSDSQRPREDAASQVVWVYRNSSPLLWVEA